MEPGRRFFARLDGILQTPVDDTPLASPDELVASRFTVIRFMASGAMGEVYEAHDSELNKLARRTQVPETRNRSRCREHAAFSRRDPDRPRSEPSQRLPDIRFGAADGSGRPANAFLCDGTARRRNGARTSPACRRVTVFRSLGYSPPTGGGAGSDPWRAQTSCTAMFPAEIFCYVPVPAAQSGLC